MVVIVIIICVFDDRSRHKSEIAFYNPLLSLPTTVIIQCRQEENVMWKWKKSLQDDYEEYVAHKHALLCHRKIYSVSNNMKFSDETPFTTE